MLSGLLYFHRISDNRVAGTPLRNLNMLQELCGRDNFQNVVFVTTMWNEVSQDEGRRREEELQSYFWHSMIELGSTTHRFDLTEESAWDIINTISVSPPDERRPLQIQREMVDENKPLVKTSAGKSMRKRNNGSFLNVRRIFGRSDKNLKGRKGTHDKAPVPPQHYRFPRLSSVSLLSYYTSHNSVELDLVSNSSAGNSTTTFSEQSYESAPENAIFTLNGNGTHDEVSVPPQYYRLPWVSSVSLLSYYTSHGSVESDLVSYSSAGNSTTTFSEQSYEAALENAINTLKLAESVTESVRIHCLKEAIVPALSIAQTIEVIVILGLIMRTRIESLPQAMEGIHQPIFQVLEIAASLIGVITNHAEKARLVGPVKGAIGGFTK